MGQIFSVGQLALNVVTLGATAAASAAATDLKKLKDAYERLVEIYEAASEMADVIIAAQKDP
jgi:molybdopterin biosynthesis enzyme